MRSLCWPHGELVVRPSPSHPSSMLGATVTYDVRLADGSTQRDEEEGQGGSQQLTQRTIKRNRLTLGEDVSHPPLVSPPDEADGRHEGDGRDVGPAVKADLGGVER